MDLKPYNESYPSPSMVKDCRQPTIRERLDDQKSHLESQLKRVNEAIDALNANPETARVLELISKV